jgi:hypothetical protein
LTLGVTGLLLLAGCGDHSTEARTADARTPDALRICQQYATTTTSQLSPHDQLVPPSTQVALPTASSATTAGQLAITAKYDSNEPDPSFWNRFDPSLAVTMCIVPAQSGTPSVLACKDGGRPRNDNYTVYFDMKGKELHRTPSTC